MAQARASGRRMMRVVLSSHGFRMAAVKKAEDLVAKLVWTVNLVASGPTMRVRVEEKLGLATFVGEDGLCHGHL